MRLDHDTGTSLWLVWYSREIFCCLSTVCNYSETFLTNILYSGHLVKSNKNPLCVILYAPLNLSCKIAVT